MPEPDAVASPDEFALMLNAYTDGASALGKATARRIATNEQKQVVADGYRSLLQEYDALARERDLAKRIVAIAAEIEQALGERPVDLTNETRWELDPTLLNVLVWEMNAYRAATAPPDDAVHPADTSGG